MTSYPSTRSLILHWDIFVGGRSTDTRAKSCKYRNNSYLHLLRDMKIVIFNLILLSGKIAAFQEATRLRLNEIVLQKISA
jgi:hypothetical protein